MLKQILTAGGLALALSFGNAQAEDIYVDNNTQWNVALGATHSLDVTAAPYVTPFQSSTRGRGTAAAGSTYVDSNCECDIKSDNNTQYNLAIGSSRSGSVSIRTIGTIQ